MAKLSENLENYNITGRYNGTTVTLLTPNSGNTKDLIIYADGGGMPDQNTVELSPFLNNNPKSVMLLNGSINGGTVNYRAQFNPAIDNYVEEINQPINLNIIGFSGGTTDSIRFACEQAQKVNSSGTPICDSISVNVISTAYGYMKTGSLTDTDYQALANANGKVMFYCHDTAVADVDNQRTYMSNVNTMKNAQVTSDLVRNGVPTYVVETHYIEAGFSAPYDANPAGHGSVNQAVMKYFIPMLYGEAADGVDRYFDIEVAVADASGNITEWKKVNSTEIKQVFSDTYMQVFKDKYKDLGNINPSTNTNDGSSTLSSSLSEVYNGMLAINNDISNTSSIFKLETVNYDDGTCSIPKNLSNSVESLFNVSRSVMNSLATDTEAICSIAQYINDMDKNLSSAANELDSSFYQKNEYLSFKEELNSIDIDINKVDISMFSTNNISGKSGRASSSEIMNATKSLVSSLDLEVSDSKKMKTSIDNFISKVGTGNFLGNVWNNVSDSLSKYSALMDIRSEAANTLSEALKVATAYVIDYIGEDEEIDDSKIPELENDITNLKKEIEKLEAMCNSKHTEYQQVTASDGTVKYNPVEVYDYSESARANFKADIDANKEAIVVLEEKLNKYKGLADVINKAQKIIEEALNCIKGNYTNATSNIKNIKNFTFSTDGIDYKSILGSSFNKTDYLNKYDTYTNKYESVSGLEVTDNEASNINASASNVAPSSGANYQGGQSNPSVGGNVSQPVEKPAEQPAVTPTETPAEKPTETPVEEPTETPVEEPAETPVEEPAETPVEEPAETPVEEPAETPVEEPAETPVEEPTETPVEEPTETPVEKPTETSVEKPNPTIPQKPNQPSKPISNIPISKIDNEPIVTEENPVTSTAEPIISEVKPLEVADIIEIEPVSDINQMDIKPIIEEPVRIEPIVDNSIETISAEQPTISPTGNVSQSINKNNSLKTIGTLVGAGAAIGAASFGTHTVMKARENSDDYEDLEEES